MTPAAWNSVGVLYTCTPAYGIFYGPLGWCEVYPHGNIVTIYLELYCN